MIRSHLSCLIFECIVYLNLRFADHLTEILENDRPAWDHHNEYHLETVNVYFVDFATGGYIPVDKVSTIGQVLQDKRSDIIFIYKTIS